ncbi:MAG: VOC family protein [Gaiellaceae bacterium]|jgi:hypothetical protein
MAHALLQRLHNPHGYTCGCDGDCWCRRTTLGRAFRWWFPARWFGIQHKNATLQEWKRDHPDLAAAWKQERAATSSVRVVGHEPCLEVADVTRAVEHYRQLGFTISFYDESYAFAHRDRLTIRLGHSDKPTIGGSTLYMHVDDADRLADDWRTAGFEVLGPHDTDYGKREGSHRDADGNLLRFGSPLRRRG